MAEFSFTYRAFISYAHADHQWAVWLHRALERYRVPRRIAGAEGLRRLGKIFRDEDELAAAAELGPKIEAALSTSDVLIVVCSPRSAQSKWVNQEIEAFKRLGRTHRVFALIADGEPHCAGDLECFPEALKRNPDGSVAEPLAVDIRKFGREDAALRLIAGILDVGYDDLRQRAVRQRRAELRRAQALFASGLVLVAGALAGGYLAASNYVDASERTSRLFAREANALFNEGYHAKAMLMALYGDPAAQAGLAESLLRPQGYAGARNALARNFIGNRLERTLAGGDGGVTSVAFSRDGASILTGDGRGAKLWRLGGNEAPLVFDDNGARASSVAFSADGKRILMGCLEDRKTRMWSLEGGNPQAVFGDSGGPVVSVAFSPDGTKVLTGTSLGDAKLWSTARSAQEGEELRTFGGTDGFRFSSVAFSPDGSKVLTGSQNGSATLWAIADATEVAIFGSNPGAPINAVAFSPDGSTVLTGAADGSATLWPVMGGDKPKIFRGHQDEITSVAFSHDGEMFVTGSRDGTAKLWSRYGGRELATFTGHDDEVTSVGLSPDGRKVLTGSRDGTAKVWQVDEPKPLSSYRGHDAEFTAVALSPDWSKVLTGARNGAVTIWAATGAALATFPGPGREPSVTSWDPFGTVWATAFSPDGTKVMAGFADGTAKLWSVSGGDPQGVFGGHKGRIVSIAASQDGAKIATASDDGTARVWPASGSEPFVILSEHKDALLSVAFSPDSKKVLTGSRDRTAKLWLATGGKALATFTGHASEVGSVAFSFDGSQVITSSSDGDSHHTIKFWTEAGGMETASISGVGAVPVLAPHGNLLLTGDPIGSALYPASGGEPLVKFHGNGWPVLAQAFSPDTTKVAMAFADGGMRIWAIDPIVTANEDDQVSIACTKLKAIGVTVFAEKDFLRFPILDRNVPNPCTKVWGFDPRTQQEADAKARTN